MTAATLAGVAILAPMLLAVLIALRSRGSRLAWAVPLAAVPALALTFAGGDGRELELPWLLFGSVLGVDAVNRTFLGFTAVLWLLAGVYAGTYFAGREDARRFHFFFLLAMAANFGVVLALDAVSFFVFFAILGFAVYGLVIHDLTKDARRAGRVYLGMALVGEVAVFAGLAILAGGGSTLRFSGLASELVASPSATAVCSLFLVAFGIKLGLAPLHVWLPLAHPVAPTPASAMLSGVIVKTGLLGLLRMLPLGEMTLPGLGTLCIAAGVVSAFGAVVVGLMQSNGKTILAYSTVSQMGIVAAAIGVALHDPAAWPALLPVVLLMAAHHGLTKASLFLGVGVARAGVAARGPRRLIGVGLVIGAVALAGGPATLGAVVKSAIKDGFGAAAFGPAATLAGGLILTSLASGLLMLRFLAVEWPGRPRADAAPRWGLWIPWFLTVGLVVGGGWIVPRLAGFVGADPLAPKQMWMATWPLLLAGGVAVMLRSTPGVARWLRRLRVPAGDLLIAEITAMKAASKWSDRVMSRLTARGSRLATRAGWIGERMRLRETGDRLALRLETWLVAGSLLGVLVTALFVLLALGA